MKLKEVSNQCFPTAAVQNYHVQIKFPQNGHSALDVQEGGSQICLTINLGY